MTECSAIQHILNKMSLHGTAKDVGAFIMGMGVYLPS